MRYSVSLRVLLCVALLSCLSVLAQGQSSTLPSTDTAQPLSLTTPTVSPSSQSLLDTLDKAISSSMNTDAKLDYYKGALQQEKQQRQSDNDSRQKEIDNWRGISETLSAQVETQQKYLSDFDTLLGVTSGSEAEKQKAALAAVDTIKADAKGLELQLGVWKIAGITFGVGLGAVAVYEAGHLLKVW
jgi:hypothetical protein